MAISVYLRAGSGTDVYLRRDRTPDINVYLRASSATNDVYLRPNRERLPGVVGVAPSFPTQYSGLRYYLGTVKELCLVAEADAPTGMGGVWKITKGGAGYAVYLVETTDPNASQIRIKTSTGIKAARLKT